MSLTDSESLILKIAEIKACVVLLRHKKRLLMEELFKQFTEAENGPPKKKLKRMEKLVSQSLEASPVVEEKQCDIINDND
mmetsp:Transcript_24569/g.24809  ORF Transcript_24569/g.24809 Transcript_24569/m.24809 type:complete len:80 (-) Transcript_24569:136-375(-)